jgi:exosortase A-associated hydrolase 1
VFDCDGDTLVGIIHGTGAESPVGVLIVVGGPQYRVGSHRQFLLLARSLAAAGIPAMRFDYRGMGDSGGEARSFEVIDEDIERAIDVFCEQRPELRTVVLWGLCDAASAILTYAYSDARVGALILSNPWVHTEQAEARVRLKNYYIQRLFSKGFWRKLFSGGLDVGDSWRSLVGYAAHAFGSVRAGEAKGRAESYVERMRGGLARFGGPVFLILSGKDITADEFRQLAAGTDWSALCEEKGTEVVTLPDANHTFARAEWRDAVADRTIAWVRSLA